MFTLTWYESKWLNASLATFRALFLADSLRNWQRYWLRIGLEEEKKVWKKNKKRRAQAIERLCISDNTTNEHMVRTRILLFPYTRNKMICFLSLSLSFPLPLILIPYKFSNDVFGFSVSFCSSPLPNVHFVYEHESEYEQHVWFRHIF